VARREGRAGPGRWCAGRGGQLARAPRPSLSESGTAPGIKPTRSRRTRRLYRPPPPHHIRPRPAADGLVIQEATTRSALAALLLNGGPQRAADAPVEAGQPPCRASGRLYLTSDHLTTGQMVWCCIGPLDHWSNGVALCSWPPPPHTRLGPRPAAGGPRPASSGIAATMLACCVLLPTACCCALLHSAHAPCLLLDGGRSRQGTPAGSVRLLRIRYLTRDHLTTGPMVWCCIAPSESTIPPVGRPHPLESRVGRGARGRRPAPRAPRPDQNLRPAPRAPVRPGPNPGHTASRILSGPHQTPGMVSFRTHRR
jgi:hypothetical protein